jgi:hypothetical protein
MVGGIIPEQWATSPGIGTQRRPHASRRIVIFATGVATYGLSPKRSSFDEGIKAALNDREWLDDRDPKANKVRLRETLRREWCLECDPQKRAGRHGRFRRNVPPTRTCCDVSD